MSDFYFCKNKRRRAAVDLHPLLNGIDYLEVLDLEAPAGSPRQQTLLLRCLKPLPASFSAEHLRLSGGVRVTGIGLLWAAPASQADGLLADGRINADERDFLLAQLEPEKLLVVRTQAAGDYSTYRLCLVDPPGAFDPRLSCVDFSFKIECPTDFDCLPATVCPPEEAEEPDIHYLAKDYASFRQLMLDRLSVVMPEWTERSPADVGIAIVEVLAYAADQLSYYQDAVASEAYLGTARRRPSVRRHARLLDYPMHDGCNARAWVAFEVSGSVSLPALDVTGVPTRLLTRIPEDAPRFPPDELGRLRAAYPVEVFEMLHDVTLDEAHNQISFYTWGDDECCLPRGATRATLVDDLLAPLQLAAGDVLILEERLDPGTGQAVDADPLRRHAVRLTRATPGEDALHSQPVVEIEWAAADALPFPLCLSTVIEVAGLAAPLSDVSIARGNVALADHGLTLSGEALERPGGHLRYRPRLAERHITFAGPPSGALLESPAAGALHQDPRRALPFVRVEHSGDVWSPQRDLLDSDRTMRHFVVEMENDGRARLRFGDGEFGRRLGPVGEHDTLQASYRVGNGPAGNVGAGAIAHILTSEAGIERVHNPLPARGGTVPEALEEVRQYAPQAFRTQERAVTEADYAVMAGRHPAVAKARATRRWTGSWHTMFVTADRAGGLEVNQEFEDELRSHLDRYRLAGHDLEIDPPRFIPLDIAFTVCVRPGYFRSDVRQALLESFSSVTNPDGHRGFFHPDNFTFGQPLYLSSMIAAAMQVAGVEWVDFDDTPPRPNRFRRWGETAHGEIADGLIAVGRLEIIRLDNDPSQPENGRLELFMEGGL
jgi:hypothetical protein